MRTENAICRICVSDADGKLLKIRHDVGRMATLCRLFPFNKSTPMKLFAGLLFVIMFLNPLSAAEDTFPLNARRILFLGDSITHAGEFINMTELQLRLHSVDPIPELVNAGFPVRPAPDCPNRIIRFPGPTSMSDSNEPSQPSSRTSLWPAME